MFMKHPAIAKRWAREYGVPKNLPEHAKINKKKKQVEAIKRSISK